MFSFIIKKGNINILGIYEICMVLSGSEMDQYNKQLHDSQSKVAEHEGPSIKNFENSWIIADNHGTQQLVYSARHHFLRCVDKMKFLHLNNFI